VESGLFKMAAWAAAIDDVPGEARAALSRELHAQLAQRLSGAHPDHVARVADYVVKLGQLARSIGG
jgi:signal transduction histidine kinase